MLLPELNLNRTQQTPFSHARKEHITSLPSTYSWVSGARKVASTKTEAKVNLLEHKCDAYKGSLQTFTQRQTLLHFVCCCLSSAPCTACTDQAIVKAGQSRRTLDNHLTVFMGVWVPINSYMHYFVDCQIETPTGEIKRIHQGREKRSQKDRFRCQCPFPGETVKLCSASDLQ